MLRASLLLVLASACSEPVVSVAPAEVVENGLCLSVEPRIVNLVDVDEAQVTLSVPDDCETDPFVHIPEMEEDDPDDAFEISADGRDLPFEVEPDAPLILTVRRVATEPGSYEGQLQLLAVGFGDANVTVQLYAEVPAQGDGE